MINRSTTWDTPIDPMALYLVALLFGTLVAETILASVHVRAQQQAGHMGASDLIKALQKQLARRGPSTYGSTPTAGDGDDRQGNGACRSDAAGLFTVEPSRWRHPLCLGRPREPRARCDVPQIWMPEPTRSV